MEENVRLKYIEITSTKTCVYNVKLVRTFPFLKVQKKMDIDTEISGQLETTRQETYSNTIPSVLELVENDRCAENQLLKHQQQLQISQ